MYARFFEEPNGDIIESVMMTFDTVTLLGLLSALPSAIVELLNNPPEKTNDDPDLDEDRRQHLNQVIYLASLLVDVTKIFTNERYRTMSDRQMMFEGLLAAAYALKELQKVKKNRIAEIHALRGEHFGSQTGFQTTDYNEDANRILKFVQRES